MRTDEAVKPILDPETPASEVILRGLAAGEVGVWWWDRATGKVYWTPNLEAIHRLPTGSFDGTFRFFEQDIHPDDRAEVLKAIGETLASGGPYRVQYRISSTSVDEPRWLEARGHTIEEGGEIVGLTGICQDITERKRVEAELRRRVRQQEAIARLGQLALTELGPREQALFDAVVAETAEALEVEFCKLLELMPGGTELLLRAGVGWRDGLVGTTRLGTERESQAGYALKAGGAVVVSDLLTETRFSAPPLLLEHGVVSGLSVLIAGEDGRDYGVLGAHSNRRRRFSQADVDFVRSVANLLAATLYRNRAVERQELLVRELRHRAGNLLSLIVALFNNSASNAGSIAELEEKFVDRLMSLSRAHSIISQGGWQLAYLRGLVTAVLEPYADRVEIDGADVGIGADAGVALSLAIHELATNAAKYGALSASEGKVTVRWWVERRDQLPVLVVDWLERGGPTTTPPAAPGFGSKLVAAVVERQLNGTLAVDFAEHGLHLRMEVPI